ncbi:hypothetical protein FS837_001214 [Tulasnella sp. UAMH 9824]|nr:hypothetical protein FS837_001214 [Tulasnella sp. UAMH 9824]
MTRTIGGKLRHSSSSDIELLTAIRHDLQSDREDGFPGNDASRGAADCSGSPPAEDSVSVSEDENWVEEWDLEDLYRWLLHELRGTRLFDSTVGRGDIKRRLEERLALCESILSFDEGALPGVLNSSTKGINVVESVQEDAALSCPMSSLPVELLQDIFHFTRSFRREIRIPLTLSHVSSHFRSVAIGTPSLWSTIDNVLPISIAELYITRSGEGPLHFCMSVDLLANTTSLQRNRWLDILSNSSGRIKCVGAYRCESAAFWQWTNMLDDRRTVFSCLTRLELLVSESGQTAYGGPNCPVWEWFPALQDLWIQGYPREGGVSDVDPFPPGLRRLKFSKWYSILISTLFKALESLTDLRALSLDHGSLSTPPQHRKGITMTS